jgi:hypothetical protein
MPQQVIFQRLGALWNSVHLPFITCQWKSVRDNGAHYSVQQQAARDCATIVNYLHRLYKTSYPNQELEVIQTFHVCMTCDLESAYLYVHWPNNGTDSPAYEMEILKWPFLAKSESVAPPEDSFEIWRIGHARNA